MVDKKNLKIRSEISEDIFLFVEIFQNGALQLSKKFRLDRFFKSNILFGDGSDADLSIFHAKIKARINLFKIGRKQVGIYLDPRFTGYINNGDKFGEIREFTQPKGALGIVASISKPLFIQLKRGARGKISFAGFDLVFKVDKIFVWKEIKNTIPIENPFFKLPDYDSNIERTAIPIAMIGAFFTFIPVLYWLLHAPADTRIGLLRVDPVISRKLIAPENFRILPFVYQDMFSADKLMDLTFLWTYELFLRWENAEKGLEHNSLIPFLNTFKSTINKMSFEENYLKTVLTTYNNLNQSKNNNFQKYYLHIKESPKFFSLFAGNEFGSNYQILARRLDQMKKLDHAILAYLFSEHMILKKFYKEKYSATKKGIVDPPQTGQVLGPQPSEIFQTEFLNYQSAEEFAESAESSNYLKKLREKAEEPESISFYRNDLVLPLSYMKDLGNISIERENNFEILLKNALYSTGSLNLTPDSKPNPYIDQNMVDFLLFNKKEEIRACYNSALRKNNLLKGKLNLGWTIFESGKAGSFKFISGLSDQHLLKCVKNRISEWNFPKPKHGSVSVKYVFNFKIPLSK